MRISEVSRSNKRGEKHLDRMCSLFSNQWHYKRVRGIRPQCFYNFQKLYYRKCPNCTKSRMKSILRSGEKSISTCTQQLSIFCQSCFIYVSAAPPPRPVFKASPRLLNFISPHFKKTFSTAPFADLCSQVDEREGGKEWEIGEGEKRRQKRNWWILAFIVTLPKRLSN